MPHPQPRYEIRSLKRKLKFAKVVAIQGVRQCGKSFLVKHFLRDSFPDLKLERFDLGDTRTFATKNPDLFLLERAQASPLVIDEAQKVPGIFDAIKVRVDEDPSPGRYILLGSTEFSHKMKIQESLTGRMSRLRLYPLTLAECLELPYAKDTGILSEEPRVTISQVLTMLERGGMPGIFAVRSDDEREGLFDDWVNLTCNRDLHQIPRAQLDSDLAREILRVLAILDDPIESELAKALRVSLKVIRKHVQALETLFVIQPLRPHVCGTGKNRYYLCDAGIARFLGAKRQRLLETWMFHELSARRAMLVAPSKRRLTYYRTTKGSTLPFVIEDDKLGVFALNALYKEKSDRRDLEIIKSFRKALEKSTAPRPAGFFPSLMLASPARTMLDDVSVRPWGVIA